LALFNTHNFNFIELNRISEHEERALWELTIDEQMAFIQHWQETKSTMNLGKMLDFRNEHLVNFEEFVKFFELLAFLSLTDGQMVLYIVRELSSNEKWGIYIITNREEFREFVIKKIINNEKLNSVNFFLIERVLSATINNKIKLFSTIDISEFKQEMLFAFKKLFKNINNLNYSIVRNLYSNIETIELEINRIIISKEALKFFRDIIENKEFKHDFIAMQIRARTVPPMDEYVFEPFNYQIFGLNNANWIEEFSNYVNNYSEENELKQVVLKYIDELKKAELPNQFIFRPLKEEIEIIKNLQESYK